MKKKICAGFSLSTHQLLLVLPKLKLMVTLCMLLLSIQLISINSFAQYTKLLDFNGVANGAIPESSLFYDGSFLYGTTSNGGTNAVGTIFKLKVDGTGYVKLHDCTVAAGFYPYGSLISDGTFLYGMMGGGGINNAGTVFKIKPDGTGYTNLLDFDVATKGSLPHGSLVSDGTFLYGMTTEGGANSRGTIFKIKPDGTGYVKLLDFAYIPSGAYPFGSLISDGIFLYGMTSAGGINGTGLGTIFKIKTDGNGFVKLLDFDYTTNGETPHSTFIYDGTFLYATTPQGGPVDGGTIFKIKPDGTGYNKLLVFSGSPNGYHPVGSLVSDGTFLYGMTRQGGSADIGVLYKIKPDGTEYTNLISFTGTANGNYPNGDLITDGTFLYGMTTRGGIDGMGTIFKYALTIIALPTITNFTAASGPIGTTVIITGTNFSSTPADNTVRFNGTLATATASTPTSITTTVPAGASTGTITVTVAGNTATSVSSFIVTVGVVTGIEQQKNGWEIYPNPFTATLFIKGASKGKMEIEIVDVLGRSVKRISEFNSDTISLEGLEDGSYFLNIHSAKQSSNFRIIKIH